MATPLLRSVPLLALAGALAAQSYVVTPTLVEKTEGNANNSYPWANTSHYMQLHGDLKGTPRAFTGIAWRRDGTLGNTSSYTPRTLDMEIHMGDGSLASASTTFASNYLNTPVNVFTRKNVNTPDWIARRDSEPTAWDFALVFDVPYAYTGSNDLVYEIVIHANSALPNFFAADSVSSTASASWNGSYQAAGTGCTTANGVMGLRCLPSASPTTQLITLRWGIERGPSSAQTTILIGLADPNLPVPGLCTNLRTDGTLISLGTTTGTTGNVTTPALTVPYSQGLAGFPFTCQAFALDQGQGGIPVAGSNGLAVTMPTLPATPPGIARIFAQGSPTATSGTLSNGTGLVTRLRY